MAKRSTRGRASRSADPEARPEGDTPRPAGKNIVLCSDGTGNSGGKARGTNVWTIFNAVWRGRDTTGTLPPKVQVTFYDDGVGTSSFKPLKILGGAFGFGYSRNVRDLYKALVLTYDPDDSLYLFGFSRGAYTVRVLAGLILACGILDRHQIKDSAQLDKAVERVFHAYRKRYRTIAGRALRAFVRNDTRQSEPSLAPPHKDPIYPPETTGIAFIGVWDTVDAVGMPMDWMADLLNLIWPYKFPDNNLSDRVAKACHALAIDDERRTFWPVMWNEKDEPPGRIEQVWFPGVHSNIGGGYPKDQMAEVSLDWMMQHAAGQGLHFYADKWSAVREGANAHGKLYDSRAGLAAYYRYAPRDIAKICKGISCWRWLCEKLLRDKARCTAFFGPPVEIARAKVHFSALRRASRATEDYAPVFLPREIEVVATDPKGDESLRRRLSDCYADTVEARTQDLLAARRVVTQHRVLYNLFIAYSLVIVGAAAWFYWCPPVPALAAAAQEWPWPLDWVFGFLDNFVPEVLAKFFAPLAAHLKANPWDLLAPVVAMLALLLAKKRLGSSLRHRALDAWQSFRGKLYDGRR